MGLWVREGPGDPPPVRDSTLFPALRREEARLGVLHGGLLHVLPPNLAAPPWVALPMYSYHTIASAD